MSDQTQNIEELVEGFKRVTMSIAQEEEVSPIWALLATRDANGTLLDEPTLMLVPVSFGNSIEKNDVARVIASLAEKVAAQAVMFATEAWMVTAKPGADGGVPDLSVPPAEHPDREEFVMVMVETDTHHTLWRAKITNLPGHTPESPNRSIGEWTGGEPDKAEGRFTNMLRRINKSGDIN